MHSTAEPGSAPPQRQPTPPPRVAPAPEPPVRRVRPSLTQRLAARLAVLVLGGFILVYLRPILVPLVLAILLSFLVLPLVGRLTARGVPGPIAIILAETVATLPFLAMILVFMATVGPLSEALPKYQQRLTDQTGAAIDAVLARVENTQQREQLRAEITENLLPRVIGEGVSFAQSSLRTATTVVGYFFLTLVLCAFILVEGRRLREKFAEAFGPDHSMVDALDGIGRDVRAYVVAKTWISALTGFCVWILLEVLGVDFAAFWGLLAFPLNFVPTVGSIAASIPPILVAIVDPEMSLWGAVAVATGLLSINLIIGTFLDPRFVGQAVKLSPLVVFVSMLVWGVLWGPVGMILAVPIIVSAKVVFARVPQLAPMATLMKG